LDAGLVPTEDFPSILAVYKCSNVTKPSSLLENLEDFLLERTGSLTADVAVKVVIAYGESIQNPELTEGLEKIIAESLDDLVLQEDSEFLLRMYRGFMATNHVRPKILLLLVDRIVEKFDDLETSDQCEFIKDLRNIRDQTAELTGKDIKHITYVQAVLETVMP
jgi:hypothetical protein